MKQRGEEMEIIRLGESSLKISLPKEEAEKYDFIKDKNIDYETSESLKTLLDKAKKEVNFDVKGRVSVEIYASPKGECEIFVSKIKEKSTYKEKSFESQRKKGQRSIYAFDKLINLLSVCVRLSKGGFSSKSTVYFDLEKEKYYLIICDIDTREAKYAYLTEYARYVKPIFYSYILEHGKCLTKGNGVEKFSKLL
jgi:negative regulator of genetic competence, sporulation and motility